jgi:hypothetical protein
MKSRQLLASALAFCCAASSGCLAVSNCDGGCGRGCSMAFQKYDCSCDGVCGECCGDARCGCDDGCAGGCDSACDPPLRRLMGRMCGCTGCGECYWNEWHNDPPRVCEPCDRCGDYRGPGRLGYYQAPYRRQDFYAGTEEPQTTSRVPPLELAEEPADEIDDEFLE